MSKITRRDFLKETAVCASATLLSPLALNGNTKSAEPVKKRWYKGDLHQHCQWSDGDYFPEWSANWYKTHGYHFICPSDHNVFQDEELRFQCGIGYPMPEINDKEGFRSAFKDATSYWKPLREQPNRQWAMLTLKDIEVQKETFGEDSIESRTFEDVTFVRLKTFDEVAEMMNEPERFLMIPGYEQTIMHPYTGRNIHMNLINVRETMPDIWPEESYEILRQNFEKAEELYEGQNYLFTANHPLWPYYDMQPSDLIRLPQIRLYELTNNGFTQNGMERVSGSTFPEKMWDVINSYRVSHDQGILFGMGSDDFHEMSEFARGWTVVRASKLAIPELFDAIRAGDFYTSHGLEFDDIQFDGKTLEVKIDVQEEGEYVIDFIGTKKDYPSDCKYVETADDMPKTLPRTLECYSDEIGKVLDTVEGTEGSYTLKPDDLYVRAKIYKKGDDKTDFETEPAAWSQPYRG